MSTYVIGMLILGLLVSVFSIFVIWMIKKGKIS